MAIQKYQNPFEDMMPQSFTSMLDRFFNDTLHTRSMMPNFNPKVDTSETENSYEIEVSLPGLKKDEIQVDFHNGRLTISGERRMTDEKKNKKYHLLESQYGSFTRSFTLPDTVDTQAIDASFEDGILKITVPKEARKNNRQQIQIKSKTNSSADTSKSINTGPDGSNPTNAGGKKPKTSKPK